MGKTKAGDADPLKMSTNTRNSLVEKTFFRSVMRPTASFSFRIKNHVTNSTKFDLDYASTLQKD